MEQELSIKYNQWKKEQREKQRLIQEHRKYKTENKQVKKDYFLTISNYLKEFGKKIDGKFYYITFEEYKKPLKCVYIKDFGYVHENSIVLKEVMLFYNEETNLIYLIYKHKKRFQLCLNKVGTYCEIFSLLTHLEDYKLKKTFNNRVLSVPQ